MAAHDSPLSVHFSPLVAPHSSGYNNLEEVPQIFVLMGNFSSAAGDTGDGTGTIPLRGVRKLKVVSVACWASEVQSPATMAVF